MCASNECKCIVEVVGILATTVERVSGGADGRESLEAFFSFLGKHVLSSEGGYRVRVSPSGEYSIHSMDGTVGVSTTRAIEAADIAGDSEGRVESSIGDAGGSADVCGDVGGSGGGADVGDDCAGQLKDEDLKKPEFLGHGSVGPKGGPSMGGRGAGSGTTGPLRGPNGGLSMARRGLNYVRNAEARKRRRASKIKEGGRRFVVPSEKVEGAFPLVGEKLRSELQETRVKRLIAENEAAELSAKRFVARDDETEGLVRQMITRMELERKVGKLASTSKIGNWAKTVVGGHASTINSPALSKVPSLESVGLGSSVSSDESVKRETRMALYKENQRLLEQNLEAQPYLLPDQVEDAYKALVGEFADVLFTPEENAKRKIADMIQDEYASFGMNFAGAKLLVDRLSEGISYEAL